MIRLRHIVPLMVGFGLVAWGGRLGAQPVREWIGVEPLAPEQGGHVEYDYARGQWVGTNGVIVRYGTAVLTADSVAVDENTGDVTADGHVRIMRDEQVWVSEHVQYNFVTRLIRAQEFRTGKPPVFASGQGLYADVTNRVYAATNAVITTDDLSQPGVKLHAKYLEIIPGQRVKGRSATLYVEGVPVCYFPFYTRNLNERSNNFNLVPGYRSIFGPYLLASYNWFLGPELDGRLHLDAFERRGVGMGPDANFHLGPWGQGTFRYYYLHDLNPDIGVPGANLPDNRQRVYFAYQANPATNLAVKALVRYQGDTNIIREFFEGEYRENPQPNTFVEANKFWQNFSLDAYVQPRVNDFLETIERLPEVRLTGYRQQLGGLPLFYESESSLGYYRHLFGETNSILTGTNYAAARADTYHQVVLPQTFFGWLNLTPRVGGRLTYYSESSGPGGRWNEETRGVFNTGAEASLKAWRTWPALSSELLDVDGLRHIVRPSVNYVFVPKPNVLPNQLPQFDSLLPSLELLPLEFPEFNAIDDVDAQNTVRLGLGNTLQTKREGVMVDLLRWQIYTDWRLEQSLGQTNLPRFSDVYSDLQLRPRSWLSVESKTRFDVADGLFRMSLHTLTIEPGSTWSWSLGHFYLHSDDIGQPTGLGLGNNLFLNTVYLRLNEDWGLRASHYFEGRTGVLQEQAYTVYHDMRSWTAALTFRLRRSIIGPSDYTVAFTFSLKAVPRFGLGTDTRIPYSLWGG